MSDATEGASTPAVAPVCFRHTDRVSYVKCTRCARPICPDCMISASVGFQCPECVHGAAASTPRIKTPIGAPATEKPTVTYALIGINVFAFLLMLVSGIDQTATQWGMFPPSIALDNEWWRLVTSAFLHGGWLHIAFNMYVLYALGPSLERVLGHSRYLVLYLMAALGGAVCSYAFSDVMTVSVGASGAIFGLMGALVVAGRKLVRHHPGSDPARGELRDWVHGPRCRLASPCRRPGGRCGRGCRLRAPACPDSSPGSDCRHRCASGGAGDHHDGAHGPDRGHGGAGDYSWPVGLTYTSVIHPQLGKDCG